jgi:hypothetical protein
MNQKNYPSAFIITLNVILFTLITNYSFSQQRNIDTSKVYINWAEIEIVGSQNKLPPTSWFKWWYIPIAAIPPTAYIILNKNGDETILPPTINCLPDQTLSWGQELPPPNPVSIAVTNNCPDGEITVKHVGDSSNEGSGCVGDPRIVERTYQAEDGCGNSSSCTQIFTFAIDTESPTLTCPVDMTLEWGEEIPGADINSLSVSDNCTPVEEILLTYQSDDDNGGSGCSGDPRIVERTYQAEDGCGNSSSCTQTFTFAIDTESPTLTCPADMTLEWGEEIPGADINSLSVSDNCTPVEEILLTYQSDEDNGGSGCSGDPRIVERTYQAEDGCGNSSSCTQTFTFVIDTESPTLTCPADMTLEWGEEIPAADINSLIVSDNCTPVEEILLTYQSDEDNGGSGCAGDPRVVQRIYQAEDGCGNSSSCTQTFTFVIDTEPPTLTCPADMTLECSENIDTSNTGEALAADNCTPVSEIIIDYQDDFSGLTGCNATGTIQRIWTATDNCGNISNCSQTITLEDSTAPVFTDTPPDITVDCGAIPPPFDITATDNCMFDSSPNITFEETIETGCPYNIIRNWTATDECGNASTFIQVIRVEDNEAAVINCPVDAIVVCGEPTDPSVTGMPVITDNCSVTSFTFTDDFSNQTGCTGFIIRTFEVVDECGNISSCQQLINIVDTGCDFMPDIAVVDADCAISDGEISIVPITGFIYDWSNGDTGPVISNLTSGTYTVTIVNDDLTCSQILPIIVPSAPPYTLNLLSINHPSLPGASDGNIELIVSDPNILPPLTILLNGNNYGTTSSTTFLIENLSEGFYTIQLIDFNGCPSTEIMVELIDGVGFGNSKNGSEWIIDLYSAGLSITNWNELHRETFDMDQVFEDLKSVIEHPPVENSFELFYLPDYTNLISGGIFLKENLLLRSGFGQFSGKAYRNFNEGRSNPFYMESRFLGMQFFGGLRRYFGNENLKFSIGTDFSWKDLSVKNSILILDQQYFSASDNYSKEYVNVNFTGGVQFPIGKSLNIEFEFQQAFEKEQFFRKSNYFSGRNNYKLDLKYQF